MQRQRSSVTAGLLNPFSHLFWCQAFPKCLFANGCSSVLMASSLWRLQATVMLLPPPPLPPLLPPPAIQFPALRMWPAVKLSHSSFLPVFGVVPLSFGAFAMQQYCKKSFQAPKLRALTTSPRGFELAMEKKIIERTPVPLCFRRKEFASWQCASSLARWGTCWDYMTSGGVDWA